MVLDGLLALPQWLLVGLGLGAAGSVVAAGLFVIAHRLFPEPTTAYDGHTGESRRRTEIREYLERIGERYAEDHFVEGQHVAFYLPERDVAITFDARAFYRIERSPTYPVLVEHEMPGLQLGERLPFETPDVTVETPSERRDPVTAAFAELGVQTGADLAEVKAAYRQRVKETHPDQGGDEDEFKRVREAYTRAKNHAG